MWACNLASGWSGPISSVGYSREMCSVKGMLGLDSGKTCRRGAVVNGTAGQVSVTGKASRASVERRNDRDF